MDAYQIIEYIRSSPKKRRVPGLAAKRRSR